MKNGTNKNKFQEDKHMKKQAVVKGIMKIKRIGIHKNHRDCWAKVEECVVCGKNAAEMVNPQTNCIPGVNAYSHQPLGVDYAVCLEHTPEEIDAAIKAVSHGRHGVREA